MRIRGSLHAVQRLEGLAPSSSIPHHVSFPEVLFRLQRLGAARLAPARTRLLTALYAPVPATAGGANAGTATGRDKRIHKALVMKPQGPRVAAPLHDRVGAVARGASRNSLASLHKSAAAIAVVHLLDNDTQLLLMDTAAYEHRCHRECHAVFGVCCASFFALEIYE